MSEELADDESEMQALKCMPLMLAMAAECSLDRPEPDFDTICAEKCQVAVKTLQTTCSGADNLGDWDLGAMTGLCGGCPRAALALGQPGTPGMQACKLHGDEFQTGKLKLACNEGCQPYMCAFLEKCPADQDPGVPGLTW